ncbi:MAG: TonB family protein [Acidobacteria bacterium]|nr:MAG: TonB family protein [Acidobacteriota bacterium]
MKLTSLLWALFSCAIVLAQTAPATAPPMGSVEVLARLVGTSNEVTKSYRVERLVRQRGLSFSPTDDYLRAVKTAGGLEPLLTALRQAGQASGQGHASTSQPNAAGDSEAETLSHLERGIELWDQHTFNDAAKELRAALKIEPENVYLHLSLATILTYNRDKKAAVEECRRAIQLQPDCADAHMELAILLDDPKNPAKAVPEYQEALRLEPDYSSVRFRVGYVMLQQGNVDGAIALYHEGLQLAPLNPGLHRMLGEALAKKGDIAAAEGEFRAAAALPVDANIPKRIRVGGQVIAAKRIYFEKPVYPDDAKAARVAGVVRLEVVIGRDGSVAEVKVLSGNPLLAPAAVNAVRKWWYQPILMNGSPVEVLTEIDINFELATAPHS